MLSAPQRLGADASDRGPVTAPSQVRMRAQNFCSARDQNRRVAEKTRGTMTLASSHKYLRRSPRRTLALALALALPLIGGCEVKITDFQESDTAATESSTGTKGSTTGIGTDTDTDTDTDSTDGSSTSGTATDGSSTTGGDPTTTDGSISTSANPTTGGVLCESLGSQECSDAPECLWVEINSWQEAEECPTLGGEGSCIAGQYVGDGCLFFEECNPERVYQREVGPGEFELFEATSCGTEPVGDWELCNPGELSSACECFCSP